MIQKKLKKLFKNCLTKIPFITIIGKVLLRNQEIQKRGLSSAGRASALQAEGHRFEPYRSQIRSVSA